MKRLFLGIRITPDDALLQLADELQQALIRLVKTIREFIYFQELMNKYKNVILGVTFVHHFKLIESHLGPQGPKYLDLENFNLID